MKLLIAILIFLLVCAASAFSGWMSGYDFAHRHTVSGVWTAITIVVAAGISIIYYEEDNDGTKS